MFDDSDYDAQKQREYEEQQRNLQRKKRNRKNRKNNFCPNITSL